MFNTIVKCCLLFVAFSVLISAAPTPLTPEEAGLEILFAKLLKKRETAKSNRLLGFISRAVPYGVDPNMPSFGEYETFRSDKSANFVNDGQGHIVFRQYRRARLSDILHNVNRRAGGV